MAVRIVADSTCDLSPALIQQYGITILPLYVTLGDTDRRDGIDITASDIFSHVDGGGALPKTAAVTVNDFTECFTKLSETFPDDEIICITIGAKFSCCYQNACIAAEGFAHVVVVDSQNLSSGFGHVVLSAAEMAESGMYAAEIAEGLNRDIVPRVDATFIVDRLDYLYKGGRCSAVAALGANLLKLKPCIAVENGEMRVIKKYRGSFERCIEQYVRDRLADADGIVKKRIFITHAAANAEAVQTAERTIHACADFAQITETQAGCTVSSHCGPNTLGVLFIRK